jgi:hypothetical protein
MYLNSLVLAELRYVSPDLGQAPCAEEALATEP